MNVRERLTIAQCLSVDRSQATLIGRVWSPAVAGPMVELVRDDAGEFADVQTVHERQSDSQHHIVPEKTPRAATEPGASGSPPRRSRTGAVAPDAIIPEVKVAACW